MGSRGRWRVRASPKPRRVSSFGQTPSRGSGLEGFFRHARTHPRAALGRHRLDFFTDANLGAPAFALGHYRAATICVVTHADHAVHPFAHRLDVCNQDYLLEPIL